jgi:hypothetical protein
MRLSTARDAPRGAASASAVWGGLGFWFYSFNNTAARRSKIFLRRCNIMQIRIFTIPNADSGSLQAEMNAFLSGHKVLEIEQKFFQNENGGYWTFCVRYINGGVPPSQPYSGKKVDYREILNDKDFSIFSKLRVIRKELAAADGSPAYVVFTDEELANIARLPEITEKAMLGVQGVGDKKVAKYGKALIDRYNALGAANASGAADAANKADAAGADGGAAASAGEGAGK